MTDCTPYNIPQSDLEIARVAFQRFSRGLLSDDELRAEHREIEDSWYLWKADLAAEDFQDYPRRIVENAIAWDEARLVEIVRLMERRVRARIMRERAGTLRTDASSGDDWATRFDRLRRVNIVTALGTLGVELTRRGREWKGLCPFHHDRTPSFSVNEELGLWYCYVCAFGGDLVEFSCRVHGTSRVEAARYLEETLG